MQPGPSETFNQIRNASSELLAMFVAELLHAAGGVVAGLHLAPARVNFGVQVLVVVDVGEREGLGAGGLLAFEDAAQRVVLNVRHLRRRLISVVVGIFQRVVDRISIHVPRLGKAKPSVIVIWVWARESTLSRTHVAEPEVIDSRF